MKQQKGFIFIITLCVIAVMSLLLFSSMQHVLLYQRAANNQERKHQRFYQLEHSARQLMGAPMVKDCIKKQNSANHVLQQLIKKQGCILTAGTAKYYYIAEDLGEYPCLVALHQGLLKSTHHFRFTLLSHSDAESLPLLLQIRVIKPAASLSCLKKVNYVALGVSSWRSIDDLGMDIY